MSRHRILSVGQCGFDHGRISRHLHQTLAADVEGAHGTDDALAALQRESFDLVLVNRINDADGAPGIELIRRLKSDPALADLPVMLVSNYPDAQAEAVALGALPGFGKSELTAAATTDRLRELLGQS